MITKVVLKNWKSHLDSEFRFSKGVNALIGIMGSGKSSVMQAISFALFGTFPDLQSRRIKLDDLIMKRPQRKTRAIVELEFQVGNDLYYVKRVIELGKGTVMAEIRKNNKLLDVNPSNVTKIVEGVLEMDYDLFSRAVYSEQNGIDYFLRLPKGERRVQVDRMLQVERFEKVRERCVSFVNRLERTRAEKYRWVKTLEEEGLEEKIRKTEKILKDLESEKEDVEKRLKMIKEDKLRVEKILSEAEDMEKRFNSLREELRGIVASIDEIESSIERRKSRIEPGLHDKISRIEANIRNIDLELKRNKEELNEKRKLIASLNTEIRMISDSIDELKSAGSKCPVCESPITQERKDLLIKDKTRRIDELRKKIEDIGIKISETESVVERLNHDREALISERERIRNLLSEAEMIKEMEEKRESYLKKKISMEVELKDVEEKLKEMNILSLREDLKKKASEEAKLNERISGIEKRIYDHRKTLEDLKKRFEELERYRRELEQDERIIDMMERFVTVLRTTQNQLREEFVKTVNSIMESVWPDLYPYHDFHGIRLVVDDDYVLQLKDSTGWVSVDGIVSGGERTIACLALRIAFSMAFIPNLKWLILDEPTHNLDSNAINQFIEILKNRMGNFIEQIFIITHDERISEGVMGSLYKLDRNKDANEPTRIE